MSPNQDKTVSEQENHRCASALSDVRESISSSLKLQHERDSSLAASINRLAEALEVQNERILGLLGQTAALVDALVGQHEDDEEEGPQTYLDGTRIS
jgi:ABC-type transporter Mla subunit MlaD